MARIEIYDEDDQPIKLPTKFEVCGGCGGKGKSSAYLGAFTGDQMAEDPDFAEDYFAGRYDKRCDECKGERVVEVVDWERMTDEQKKIYERHVESNRAVDQMSRMERLMGA